MATKSFLFLLLITAVITVSGCIGTGIQTGNGILVEAFEPDFSQVYSGETVQFRIKLTNAGTARAEDVKVSFTGLEGWTAGSINTCTELGILLPQNTYAGTSGETKICNRDYVAPNIEEGLGLTYYPAVRVSYKYRSATTKAILFGTPAELRSLMDRGIAPPTESVSSTLSPISLTITTQGPIRATTGSMTFPLEVKIDNVGGGIVCKSSCDSPAEWNLITLQISGEGISAQDCNMDVPLWRGKSNTVTCTASISSTTTTGRLTKMITATASYGYFIDKATSVTVSWREGAGDLF